MTAQKSQTSEALVRSIEVDDRRVVLGLALPMRNGAWSQFEKKFSVWRNEEDEELYERARLLNDGHTHVISLRWTEKPTPSGQGVYRNVVSLEPSKQEREEVILPDEEEEEPFPAQATAGVAPGRPALSREGSGLREDTKEASIEAQVALKEAWETVRDLLRMESLASSDEETLYKTLVRFTTMGLRAMKEAKASL